MVYQNIYVLNTSETSIIMERWMCVNICLFLPQSAHEKTNGKVYSNFTIWIFFKHVSFDFINVTYFDVHLLGQMCIFKLKPYIGYFFK
jgi:hypothetical protein